MMNHGADVGDNTAAGGRATQARAVGLRLRAARKRVRLSLEAVESLSEQEFKTSALSAYERGERSITVPRLQRLAKLYGVPADSLLPADVANGHPGADPASWKDSRAQARAGLLANQEKVTIDLVKLDTLRGPERDSLKKFLVTILAQRQDFHGRTIMIRAEDLRVIACLWGIDPESVCRRLDELGLRPGRRWSRSA